MRDFRERWCLGRT